MGGTGGLSASEALEQAASTTQEARDGGHSQPIGSRIAPGGARHWVWPPKGRFGRQHRVGRPGRLLRRPGQRLRLQAARARRQRADAGLADPARRLRPQLRRRPVRPAPHHRRSQAHQRRPADLQRVRLQPGEPHLLQPAEGRAAGRQPDPRHQPVDPLSDHRPAAGGRQGGQVFASHPPADRNRAAAGRADHRAGHRGVGKAWDNVWNSSWR